MHLINYDYKKKSCGHQWGPMAHFLTNHKFDLLQYLWCKSLTIHFQSILCLLINNLKKLTQKYFILPKWQHLLVWPTSSSRSNPNLAIWSFSKAAGSSPNSWLKKKTYRLQLGPMTHFLTNHKFDLLQYLWCKMLATNLQRFLCMLKLITSKNNLKKVDSTKMQHLLVWPTSSSRSNPNL